MADSNQRKAFKGGIGLAVAVVIAWGLETGAGVSVPGEVTAAIGAICGTAAAWLREAV